ncbi:MAG: hypothetical protein HUJ56_01980 [Erysipelotrichaceae bacterium]|nr:hypothetical protein [Erysipelotrichaceae bacterium]
MGLEDIVDSINRLIREKHKDTFSPSYGQVILCIEIKQNSTFSAYRTYEASVWYKADKTLENIFTVSKTDKVRNDDDSMIRLDLDKEVCYRLVSWMGTQQYRSIVYGDGI